MIPIEIFYRENAPAMKTAAEFIAGMRILKSFNAYIILVYGLRMFEFRRRKLLHPDPKPVNG